MRLPSTSPARRALPLLFALVLLFPGLALAAEATKEEVGDYVQRITERHDALGEILVLLGRVIEVPLQNPGIVGSERFWSAVDKIDAFIKEKADEEGLEKILAGLRGDDLRKLHETFIRAMRLLKEADEVLEAANYGFSPQAYEVWNEARLAFLSFTDGLKALKAKHGLEP